MHRYSITFAFTLVIFAIYELRTCVTEQSTEIEQICHALITFHLSTFVNQIINVLRNHPRNGAVNEYCNLFSQILAHAGMKPTPAPFLGTGCALTAKTKETYFIFGLKINKTAHEALTEIESYKSKFYRDDDKYLLCMGINYEENGTGQLVCDWAADLYFENGSLKKAISRKKLTYKNRVDVRRNESIYDYYDVLEVTGRGGFGVVHRCVEKRTGSIFAAKIICVSRDDISEWKHVQREIDIMKQLHHPNLLGLLDAFEDEDRVVLIVEYLSGGLLDLDRRTRFSETEAIQYVRQICEAVKYMHERNIIHRNISPTNIMCRTRRCTEIKIIDFGLATRFDLHIMKKLNSTADSVEDHFLSEGCGFHSDMWDVGILTYLMLIGKYPKRDEDIDDNFSRNMSEEGVNFIRRLLIKEDKYVHKILWGGPKCLRLT